MLRMNIKGLLSMSDYIALLKQKSHAGSPFVEESAAASGVMCTRLLGELGKA